MRRPAKRSSGRGARPATASRCRRCCLSCRNGDRGTPRRSSLRSCSRAFRTTCRGCRKPDARPDLRLHPSEGGRPDLELFPDRVVMPGIALTAAVKRSRDNVASWFFSSSNSRPTDSLIQSLVVAVPQQRERAGRAQCRGMTAWISFALLAETAIYPPARTAGYSAIASAGKINGGSTRPKHHQRGSRRPGAAPHRAMAR